MIPNATVVGSQVTQVTVVSKREMLVEIEWDGLVTVSAARDMTTVVSPLRNTAAPYERK